MSGSGTNRLVQSTLEGGSASVLTAGLMDANNKAKTANGGAKKDKKAKK